MPCGIRPGRLSWQGGTPNEERDVRRNDREVKDPKLVEALLMRAEYVHLAMWDGAAPYVVPVNFGFEDGVLYFHGAPKGRKAECLRAHDRVSFSAVAHYELLRGEKACDYTAHYQSVCGEGRASFIEDPAEKARALDIIMRHDGGPEGGYDEKVLARTALVKVVVETLSGKANPALNGDEDQSGR
jgi:hypothetical protein